MNRYWVQVSFKFFNQRQPLFGRRDYSEIKQTCRHFKSSFPEQLTSFQQNLKQNNFGKGYLNYLNEGLQIVRSERKKQNS